MLVQFMLNKDNITTTMLVDYHIEEDEVPYVPERWIDHRGLALYLFCKYNDYVWDDLEFEEDVPRLDLIMLGFDYMKNPIYIKNDILSGRIRNKKIL